MFKSFLIPSPFVKIFTPSIKAAQPAQRKTALRSLLCAALLAPQALLALEPSSEALSGDEFEALSLGRMLTFFDNGTAYGAEQYLPNNRVRWAFDEDTCLEGIWYEEDQQICFIYQDGDAPQCWQFFEDGDHLVAVFEGDESPEVYEARISDGPLACVPDGVGV